MPSRSSRAHLPRRPSRLLFAIPIGVGCALAIVHVIPGRLRIFLSSLVELLAAVPSVVYGLWGLLVLAPWFEKTVEPGLAGITGANSPSRLLLRAFPCSWRAACCS